jgi:hypothetical protein
MTKTKDAIITQINNLIKANNNNEITGVILNGVLREMTNSLSTPYFLFPKHDSVSESDIGKIVMNDGLGTAKVYAYAPVTTEQLGEWKITLSDINDLTDDSELEIISNTFNTTINRVTWRNGNTPTTVTEELELLRDYINSMMPIPVAFLSASVSGDELTIEETTFHATKIKKDGFPLGALVVVSVSQPALPAAPTSFPLGKLIGIEGSNAIISNKTVETYQLDAPITFNNNFFNIVGNIPYTNPQELIGELFKLAIIPSSNGNARQLTASDIQPLNGAEASFDLVFRHQFLGIAIATSGNSVTVYDLKHFSLLLGVFLNLARHSVVNAFD